MDTVSLKKYEIDSKEDGKLNIEKNSKANTLKNVKKKLQKTFRKKFDKTENDSIDDEKSDKVENNDEDMDKSKFTLKRIFRKSSFRKIITNIQQFTNFTVSISSLSHFA